MESTCFTRHSATRSRTNCSIHCESDSLGEFGPLEKLRWHSWLVKLPVYSGLSIAVAAASHRWFESPVLRLKDRWFPSDLETRGCSRLNFF